MKIVEIKLPDELRCKICGEMFDRSKMLEHAVLKHNDKEAKEVLEQLNKLSGRGTCYDNRYLLKMFEKSIYYGHLGFFCL